MTFFNAEHLPKPKGEYVLWCDVMGQGQQMIMGLRTAANNVFRLHSAFCGVVREANASLYSVMDGAYITSSSYEGIRQVIRDAFPILAADFLAGRGARRKFMVRGGLAFGPTLHGRDVPPDAFFGTVGDGRDYTPEEYEQSGMRDAKDKILLSSAMAWAYEAERNAPPFGIYVHESAQAMPQAVNPTDRGFGGYLYRWWTAEEESRRLAASTAQQVDFYLTDSKRNWRNQSYKPDRIDRHRDMAREYFASLWPVAESVGGQTDELGGA